MACERYDDALKDTAAGAPPAPGLESHLSGCARCREELGALRRTLALVDSDLRQLVAAEPSPELAARIRARVEADEAVDARRSRWLWPGLAAAAAVVVAIAVTGNRSPREAAPAIATRPSPPPVAETPGTQSTPEPLAARESAPLFSMDARERRLTARRWEEPKPEVLVPPGEQEALVRLVAVVHRDRIAPAAFAAVGEPSTDLPELPAIEIQPLDIVPLDPAETAVTFEP